jgi:hypothetical protein
MIFLVLKIAGDLAYSSRPFTCEGIIGRIGGRWRRYRSLGCHLMRCFMPTALVCIAMRGRRCAGWPLEYDLLERGGEL